MPRWFQKPPTVPPMTRPIGVTVLGVPADQLAQTSVFYLLANHPSEHPAVRKAPSAQFLWHVPRSYRGAVSQHVHAPGFAPYAQLLPHSVESLSNQLPDVTLTPLAPTISLEALRVRGQFFETVSGKRWTGIGCSDFNLYQRWLDDKDQAEAIADERAVLGFNQVRVFGMFKGALGRFLPDDYTDYYDGLQLFAKMLAQRGLGLEFTAFADATTAMLILAEQITHWNRVCAALGSTTQTVLELVNEGDQPINRMDTGAFSQPADLPSSHGSNGADSLGVEPFWNYTSLHPARPADWPRRGGHNGMEIADEYRVPCTVNESCRPDQGRGPIASDHFDAAANITLLCAGGTFHSESGKYSRLFNADERRCAEAWVAGVKAVPLEFQDGRYSAGHLHDSPIAWTPADSSRLHARILGNRSCCSAPQMTAGWVPVAKDGWRIVSQDGSVILLER